MPVFVVITGFLLVFSLSGCKTPANFAYSSEGVVAEDLIISEENAFILKDWYHNAVLAEDVGDYATAIEFYCKVVNHFPETEQARIAVKKLRKFTNTIK